MKIGYACPIPKGLIATLKGVIVWVSLLRIRLRTAELYEGDTK